MGETTRRPPADHWATTSIMAVQTDAWAAENLAHLAYLGDRITACGAPIGGPGLIAWWPPQRAGEKVVALCEHCLRATGAPVP